MKTRYAITHLEQDGLRVLTRGNYGPDCHFDSPEEAARWLDSARVQLRAQVLGQRADTLQVTPVECHPHGEADGSVVGDEDPPDYIRVGDVVVRDDTYPEDPPRLREGRGVVVEVNCSQTKARVHWRDELLEEHEFRSIRNLRKAKIDQEEDES
jgi:hypothetical protein